MTLTGSNFFVGESPYGGGGTTATDAQLRSVHGALDRLAIQADWQTGADLVTLDNLVLSGPAAAAVPEPSTSAMLILGFGAIGGTMRRRKVRGPSRVAFA